MQSASMDCRYFNTNLKQNGVNMKVADYIINYLAGQGVKEVFSVYGAANGDLIDAFTRTDRIRYVCVMHEQAGGFAAEGYAKVSGNFGVALATSGPGGQNFVTPIGNCYYDSVPCLFLTGQIKTQFLKPNDDIRQIGFQETDIVGIVKPITKYATMIKTPEQVPYELKKALYLMKTGRPGPVLLDIPIDVQKAEISEKTASESYCEFPDDDYHFDLDELYGDLMQSERPALLIGAGCWPARKRLLTLIDTLKIPAFPTWNAIDIVCSDNPYYGGRVGTYGGAGRNFGIQNCDLLIAIGTRLSGRITGGNVKSFARGAKKYLIDIDKAMLQPNDQQCPFDVNWYSDADYFIDCFTDYLNSKASISMHVKYMQKWMDTVSRWRYKYDTMPVNFMGVAEEGPSGGKHNCDVSPYLFMRELSNQCSPSDIIVGDCGGNIVVMNHAFESKTGQRIITNNGNSPMGFSMAGAIGAWFAQNDEKFNIYDAVSNPTPNRRNVICIIGDGGMNMNIQELQTIVNYGVNVKIFIINNNIYGITKAFQEVNFEGRSEAYGPKGYRPPDFHKVANAYDIPHVEICDNKCLNIIKDLLDSNGPLVINVMCKEYHTYEPKIVGWNTPIEDMYPYLPRDEFKSNMIIDPLPGWETHEY